MPRHESKRMRINDFNQLFMYLMLSTFLAISCKEGKRRIITRHKNGSIALVYEFQNKNDTMDFAIKEYYPDGEIRREGMVTDGKYSGQIILYFQNGRKYQVDSLVEPCDRNTNACDEMLIRYNENGTLSQRYTVKKGRLNGLTQQYDGFGKLVKSYYLINDSVKNGVYEEFYENGRTSRHATFDRDALVGVEYIFKENGDTLLWDQYDKGAKSFPLKKWLDNGTILQGDFVDAKKGAVVWKWYDKNGKQIRTQIAYPGKSGFVVPKS